MFPFLVFLCPAKSLLKVVFMNATHRYAVLTSYSKMTQEIVHIDKEEI